MQADLMRLDKLSGEREREFILDSIDKFCLVLLKVV